MSEKIISEDAQKAMDNLIRLLHLNPGDLSVHHHLQIIYLTGIREGYAKGYADAIAPIKSAEPHT